ncbi:MAG: hypothetical protein GX491_15405 [Chloroflexi bacterium]|nr:hypothetical protein [Chloroflexota bacterium]
MHTVITKSLINQHADSGVKRIEIDDTVIVTSEAWDQAMRRGITLVRVEKAACHVSANGACEDERAEVRAKVKAAVISKLGFEPDGLETMIDRVLNQSS